jgi:hypothetical protein
MSLPVNRIASEIYTPLPPHCLTPEAEEFFKTLSPRDQALQNLAFKMLGSSHYVDKTHAFLAWKHSRDNSTPKKESPAIS